jgi:glycosyltransferase involved in cell wall biosynthesis
LRNSAVDRTGASLRFGIICRFTEQKGITFILEALKMFREKHGGVHFVFAGQGPLEGMIREWIRDQKSEVRRQKTEDGGGTATDGTDEECVATDGHRRHGRPARGRPSSSGGKPAHHTADLWAGSPPESVCVSGREDSDSSIRVMPVRSAVEVLKDLDVFVHPGLDDAMPVSIVEAQMCGVPVIGSSVGATPELVRDGVEGFIVSPSDAGAIFEAMDRFAAMGASELARFRQAARARYEEKCTPARVGGQVAAIYRGVMEACR